MTDTTEQDSKKKLALGKPGGRLELKVETGQVRQSFSHGRSKTVQVEVKRKRSFGAAAPTGARPEPVVEAPVRPVVVEPVQTGPRKPQVLKALTPEERMARQRALEGAKRSDVESKRDAELRRSEEDRRRLEDAERQRREAEAKAAADAEAAAKLRVEEEAKRKADEESRKKGEEEEARRRATAESSGQRAEAKLEAMQVEEEDDRKPRRTAAGIRVEPRRPPLVPRRDEPKRRGAKITVTQALDEDDHIKVRSVAAMRRAREKERQRQQAMQGQQAKVVREVVIPEAITVQELANRMAERSVDVIKSLMKMGVMATINQAIDADTAELIVNEFGHKFKRVAEADVEIGLKGGADDDTALVSRPPVVTIMGHVDHGKTSLLDALRETDVAKHEAGGITQHIGAYQVTLKSGEKITFLDTPGHEAFTAMRARGASVTDVVVLVVAADDGIQPQTIEAIAHAKAANVPIIVAINKIDKPGVDPDRVRRDLLQHDIAVEGMGGDVLAIEVSALKKMNLDKLEEAILLQAEVLDLKANPDRLAEGVVIEAKLERGRGSVATVLVKRGTLRQGDIFVAGSEWGRVRALIDHLGRSIEEAGPSMPVEVLGLTGTPSAGDDFSAVENEARAREITDFRQRKSRDARVAFSRGTLEQIFTKISEGAAKEFSVVVKTDVQGSLEAIAGSIAKLGTAEVRGNLLHGAVGSITEGDVALAKASRGLIIGFNVRANPQAREMARRDGVEIRYYSVIYDIIDDIKSAMSGLLAPLLRERFLGNAAIREVFNITKFGKIAGCRVTEGMVKRGAKVRLLRDNVVIHEGSLKTLRRFKDEVREVQEGYECGMAFENYQDMQVGDVIECFEVESVARAL